MPLSLAPCHTAAPGSLSLRPLALPMAACSGPVTPRGPQWQLRGSDLRPVRAGIFPGRVGGRGPAGPGQLRPALSARYAMGHVPRMKFMSGKARL